MDNKENVLDLSISKTKQNISEPDYLIPIGHSDHTVITFLFNVNKTSVSIKRVNKYHKTDVEGIKSQCRT